MTIRSGRRRGKSIIFLYLAPALLVYLVFFIYPGLDAFRISLYRWTGFGEIATYIGLANFVELSKDEIARTAVVHNLVIFLMGGMLVFGPSLLFAVVLSRTRSRFGQVIRAAIFAPYVMPSVGVALLWVFLYNPRWGLLNAFLRAIRLEKLALPWLGLKATALPAVTFVLAWQAVGFYMTLFIAGIQNIPESLYDAAKIDGASGWSMLWHVTLPLLRELLLIAGLYWMINAFRVFSVIWAMTRGGPGYRTTVISTYMFEVVLPYMSANYRLGYGTAIAVVLSSIVLIVSLSYLWFLQTREAVEY